MNKRRFHYKKILGISLALALFLGGIGIVQKILDEQTSSFQEESVVKVEEKQKEDISQKEEKTIEYVTASTMYTASLQASSKIMQPSLIDYLR